MDKLFSTHLLLLSRSAEVHLAGCDSLHMYLALAGMLFSNNKAFYHFDLNGVSYFRLPRRWQVS